MTQRETEYVCVLPGVWGKGDDEEEAIRHAIRYNSNVEIDDILIYRFYKGGWQVYDTGLFQWEDGEGIGQVETKKDDLKEYLRSILSEAYEEAARAFRVLGETKLADEMESKAEDISCGEF